MVFDGGTLGKTDESRKGSTVVDLSKPGMFTVIREGRYGGHLYLVMLRV